MRTAGFSPNLDPPLLTVPERNTWLAVLVPALLWCLVACRSLPTRTAPGARVLSVQDQLVAEFDARVLPYPEDAGDILALKQPDLLVFLSATRDTPVGGMDAATREQLRRYVEGGGRMLLLGLATRLVHEIGVEPQAPDRFAVYRWGDNDQTLLGEYRFGLKVTGPEAAELVEGLENVAEHEGAFHLGGGETVSVQSCHWEKTPPRNGRVVGRLFRVRDGEARELDAAVLTAWGVGNGGRILAYGSLPEPWRPDPLVHRNACQFLRNSVRSLCGVSAEQDSELRVVVFADKGPVPTLPEALPPLAERELPGAAVVPHWGWQVPLSYQRDGGAPAPQSVVQQVLVPSWRAGASLLDLHLWDPERGYPLGWDAQDPLRRPRTYHGGVLPEWGLPELRRLASTAHERSMLVQTWLFPDPTRLGPPVEILACSKWLARELLDVRRLGAGALDGLGVHTWFDDQEGHTRRVVERYQPALHGYCTGSQPAFFPGFGGAQNANHGRPRGLNAAGLSSVWRNAFPPPGHMLAMLDCRVRQPSLLRWGEHAHGGGSYGDWILTQVNDFARPRMGQGAAMWWQAFNERTISPTVVDYVHGVSMQPIKAAVAGRLLATGRGGYRDLVRGFVDRIQSGFGAESEHPAETPFLQNNHCRLHGTGGALLLDPTGLARFRPGDETKVVSGGFMRSSWRGVRPRVEDLDVSAIDFVLGHPRGENGYGPMLRIGEKERVPGMFPAMLAHDDPGRWPRKVEVSFRTRPGHYHLELLLRSASGQGIVELQRDGEAQKLLAFREGAGSKLHEVAFPVAVSGMQTWSLEVLGGGCVAIDGCRLVRRLPNSVYAAVPTEVRIRDRAGHLAELVEHTAAPEFQERRTIRTIADLPGFVLTIDYDWVSGRPQVTREFDLPLHRWLGSGGGQHRTKLRDGFVLRSRDPSVPTLAVIPVELPRYHHFEFTAKNRLWLTGFPRSNERVRIGFVFLRGHREQPLEELERVVADVLEPLTLQLGHAGRARIVPRAKVPYPRVVRVINANKTPYLVREAGTWLARGAQPARAGGEWLLIYHQDEGPVDILNGDEVVSGIHPGPGSLYSLALTDLEKGAVTARVLQTGPFLSAPSVVMDTSFTDATVDGKPWRYVCGRTVYLPRARGTYRIRVHDRPKPEAAEGAASPPQEVEEPALARTGAHVQSCRYDAATRVLEVFTLPLPGAEGEALDCTAWFTGGTPTKVDGGEVVPATEFTYRNEEDARAAAAAGVIVRFRPGLLRLYYGDPRGLAAPEGR